MKYNFYLAHLTWTFIKSNSHIMQKHTRKYSYDSLEAAPKKKRLQQISFKNKIK